MGGVISNFVSRVRGDGRLPVNKPGLGDIPEDCAAEILVHLSPPEICKLARLNRAFRGAASTDFVWESKLPLNYRRLVEELFGHPSEDFSKKEIFSRLSRPITFEDGKKEVWLEKRTGKICLSVSSMSMSITGIDDRRYWNFIPTNESRFQRVAYLQQIWWFEVNGEIDFHFPPGTYCLLFRLQLGKASRRFGRRVCNVEHVHGWDIKPVHFQLSTSDGQRVQSQCFLEKEPGSWINYHAGDFVVENWDACTKVKFSMTQIDCTHTKGGLCVDSVLVCPSELREKFI